MSKVNIVREGVYDTIQVEVYIKGNLIRVNEFSKGGKLIRSTLPMWKWINLSGIIQQ